jgi:hypothetical protein
MATDSLTALQIILALLTRPAERHHTPHKLLLDAIIDLIRIRNDNNQTTTLRKVRSHTGIAGNDSADTTAKRVILEEDTLPADQIYRHTLGATPHRLPYWILYQPQTPSPTPTTATGLQSTSTRLPLSSLSADDLGVTHAFTNPSKQFRKHVKPRLLNGLYHTSLYRRLILQAAKDGARLTTTSTQITTRRKNSPKQANQLFKFLWGQLYNGKLAFRYGHQPTNACRLCGAPDSCTHIAGACPANTSHIIKKHNAAVQLVHEAIRHSAKGGAALHRSPPTLISCDAGNIIQTTPAQIAKLLQDDVPYTPPLLPSDTANLLDLLDPDLFTTPTSPHFTDVTIDAKSALAQLYRTVPTDASQLNTTTAPSYLPNWVLPQRTSDLLRYHNHGVALDLVYARGIPNLPNPDPASIDKSSCSLLLIEIGFSSDLNLKAKLAGKTTKYQPLLNELRKDWGSADLVCIPIGHA